MYSPYAPSEQPVLRAPRQSELTSIAELIMLVDNERPGFP